MGPAESSTKHYAALIILFVLGAFFHGFMELEYRWTPASFAQLLVCMTVLQEAVLDINPWNVLPDEAHEVYVLSFMFGIIDCAAMRSLGSVPWAASGSMLSTAYHFARYMVDLKRDDAKKFEEGF